MRRGGATAKELRPLAFLASSLTLAGRRSDRIGRDWGRRNGWHGLVQGRRTRAGIGRLSRRFRLVFV
eukprot:scaffold166980_cov38-Prasinocladus_malaysianus.AAC.1